jgi:hypothetical protein
MEDNSKELIKTYEEYVSFLGEEIRELREIAMRQGWQSKRLKKGAEFRAKISKLKSLNNEL